MPACFQGHRLGDLLAQANQLALAQEHERRKAGDREEAEQPERGLELVRRGSCRRPLVGEA